MGETIARKVEQTKEITVTGKQDFRKAWRLERVAPLSCLRSGHENVHAYQLDAALSPSHGGPPV
jgi:hypothetical protein